MFRLGRTGELYWNDTSCAGGGASGKFQMGGEPARTVVVCISSIKLRLTSIPDSFLRRSSSWRAYLTAGLFSSCEAVARQPQSESISSRDLSASLYSNSLGLVFPQHRPRVDCLEKHDRRVGEPEEVPVWQERQCPSRGQAMHADLQELPSGSARLEDVARIRTRRCAVREEVGWKSDTGVVPFRLGSLGRSLHMRLLLSAKSYSDLRKQRR